MPTLPANAARRLGPELVATVRLALPLVFGQLSAVGMNVVDALLAGHLDAHTLGAVAVGASVWSLAIVASVGLMLAVPPSVAQLHGAGRDAEVGPLFRQALWLAATVGVGLGFAVHFGGPLLVKAIGIDPALVPDVGRFLRAIAYGAPALTLFFALRGLSEGLGLTRPTLYFSLLGLACLPAIGYVLMYGRLGVPRLGAQGSGIATAIVLWIEAIAMAIYIARRRHYLALGLFTRFDPPRAGTIGELLRLGVPMGLTVFMEASLFVAAALAIGTLGTDIVASHQIALNVATVTFMVPLGIAMATTVRIGHAAGRGDAAGVRMAGHASFVLVLGTQFVSAALMLALPHAIAALYTGDARVVDLAAQLLVLAGLFQFSDGLQVVANGALRGLKDTRVPMVATLVAYWLVGMPVGLWLAFPQGDGARGMWIGLIAGLTVAAVLLLWRFERRSRRPGLAVAAAASNGVSG